MIALARIVLRLLADLAGLVVLSLRPRRVDAATRVSLAVLSRLFDWRDALAVIRPETLIRWHRAGWRLFWRLKSRHGRPPIPLELRQLSRATRRGGRFAAGPESPRSGPLRGSRAPAMAPPLAGPRLSPRGARRMTSPHGRRPARGWVHAWALRA